VTCGRIAVPNHKGTMGSIEFLEHRPLLAIGELDLSLGDHGAVDLGDNSQRVFIEDVEPGRNGQLLLLRGSALEILNPDGSLRRSVYLQSGDYLLSVFPLADWWFLATYFYDDTPVEDPFLGSTYVGIARFNADGSPDTSFHTGRVFIDGSANAGVAIQPDGKILFVSGGELVRFLPNGGADPAFLAHSNPESEKFYAQRVWLQENGKILLMGYFDNTFAGARGLRQFNADGTIDTSFGDSGSLRLSDSQDSLPSPDDVQPLAGGKFLVSFISSSTEILVKRYTAQGKVDSGFGAQGQAESHFNNLPGTGAYCIPYVLHDGKILLIGGTADENGNSYSVIARLKSNGSIDYTLPPTTSNGALGSSVLTTTGHLLFVDTHSNSLQQFQISGSP